MKKSSLLCLLFIFAGQNLIAQNPARVSLLDKFLEKSVEEDIIPGGVFQVAKDGKLIYNKTIGHADATKTRPYQEDDIFRIASMTKAFTSVAIMQLFENGDLLIDDPVSKYLPAYAQTRVLDSFNEADSSFTTKELDRPLTIRHLMTHTSGIYYGVFVQGKLRAIHQKNDAMGYGFSHTSRTTREMADHIAELPLAHQPGEKWTYGLNMDVMGAIVEVVSGMTLDKYFDKYIFEPLKMVDTHFYLPMTKAKRLVPVFMHTENGTEVNMDPSMLYPFNPFKGNHAGGGGMSSTTGDYMRFVMALGNGGTLDGARILGRKTIEYMASNQIAYMKGAPKSAERDNGWGFGLGFQVNTDKSMGAVSMSPGTYSWGGYFNTKFWIDPKENLVFVGMTQVAPFKHGKFWDKMYAIIYSMLD